MITFLWAWAGGHPILLMVFSLFFGMYLVTSRRIRYYGWRLFGGVGRYVKYAPLYKRYDTEPKTLWEAYGLSDPQPMSVEARRIVWMRIPEQWNRGRADIVLGDKEKLPLVSPSGNSGGYCPVIVTFKKVFDVHPARVLYGCCGRYSLAKAAFLKSNVGGDPRCGGGIKSFFPPRWRSLRESVLLGFALRKKTIRGFVYERIGNLWEHSCSTDGPTGYFEVLVGKDDAIRRYGDAPKKLIEIQFA